MHVCIPMYAYAMYIHTYVHNLHSYVYLHTLNNIFMYVHTYVHNCIYVFFAVPDNITGVMLTCEAIGQINQCTVEWDVSDCSTSHATCMHSTTYVYILHNIQKCTHSDWKWLLPRLQLQTCWLVIKYPRKLVVCKNVRFE